MKIGWWLVMLSIEEKNKITIGLLKQNFPDCTFGGEDEERIMYDVGLENTYAHVDIYKLEENKIAVKIYDPESDDEPIADVLCRYGKDVVEYLELKTWRQVWNRRRKITCAGTKEKIKVWVDKNQHQYNELILIDEHPKDGWVAYLLPIPIK
jgi:hypothetical protein